MKKTKVYFLLMFSALCVQNCFKQTLYAQVAATHIYHNHMPNFWPYFDLATYDTLRPGEPVNHLFDAQVIQLQKNPPADYPYYLQDGRPMPHDDLSAYYSHHAKVGAYQYWPMDTLRSNHSRYPKSQLHVTMSAAVINNVDSLNKLQNVPGYGNPKWGENWRHHKASHLSESGFPALDLIHFTGHHSMGPLVGNSYFLKELVFHNVTLAQDYFLSNDFSPSRGFFPTELGFSEKLIPVLKKMGVEWSVVANVQMSRALIGYPLLDDPGKDTLISPPNRADLQNKDSFSGEWVARPMFNEQHVTYNNFPFSALPHRVMHVDPESGASSEIIAVPVEQAGSWEEGYLGQVQGGFLNKYASWPLQRLPYFVVAHDGDNSMGRAGSLETWLNSGNVTYAEHSVDAMGVDEYLKQYPVRKDDVIHVQNGSWIDTRDSSSDPSWYHWHLPFGIWRGQFNDFNQVHQLGLAPLKNFRGEDAGLSVSLELGYHYLERNFALLQAALNYAESAEQIFLDENPNHWSPTSDIDKKITYLGNQLNPYMYSYPRKGQASPAELAWYFLLPAMDSGFGYYDENVDDHVKPTLSMNQSLAFSKPYVDNRIQKDKTGPSIWWPQRYPYNPGSANKSKAEGWTLQYFNHQFVIYTYAFDVSGITQIRLGVREHSHKRADPKDKTYRVYDPVRLASEGVKGIDPSRVSSWKWYPMRTRSLDRDKNGVDWQKSSSQAMKVLPAEKIADLYFTYLNDYSDQLLDYFIEATDSKGNTTRTEIQQVYVGVGKYSVPDSGEGFVEDVNGLIEGTYPFITSDLSGEKKYSLDK